MHIYMRTYAVVPVYMQGVNVLATENSLAELCPGAEQAERDC